MSIDRRSLIAAGLAVAAFTPAAASAQVRDRALLAAIAGPQRSAANRVRDPFRHPAETLTFFGLKPGMTVIEISPGGGGYWTEILAPYLKATGGRYIATGAKPAQISDEAVFGKTEWVPLSMTSGPLVPRGTADLVITCRNLHNWIPQPGLMSKFLNDFNSALKPGGLLGVEEHRSDPRPMLERASNGYVATQHAVTEIERAGFKLQAKSEINANPKDKKDHPFGVWTLPPTRRNANPGQPTPANFDRAPFDAIGESDRMTLRFVKT
jgi:predicted methyltransferase